MRSLRSASIGSMRAWLPSRRSTAHQRGALVMTLSGQVRSGRSTLICCWNGTYLCTGIPEDFCGDCVANMRNESPFRCTRQMTWKPAHQPPRRETGLVSLVAAEKKEGYPLDAVHGTYCTTFAWGPMTDITERSVPPWNFTLPGLPQIGAAVPCAGYRCQCAALHSGRRTETPRTSNGPQTFQSTAH